MMQVNLSNFMVNTYTAFFSGFRKKDDESKNTQNDLLPSALLHMAPCSSTK